MSTWTAYNTRRRADHVADRVAQIRALEAMGYGTDSAARHLGWSERGLARYLRRHEHTDLLARLDAKKGPL